MSDKKQKDDGQPATRGKGKGKSSTKEIIPVPTVTNAGAVLPQKIVDANNNPQMKEPNNKADKAGPNPGPQTAEMAAPRGPQLPDFRQMAKGFVHHMMSELGLEKLPEGEEQSGLTMDPDMPVLTQEPRAKRGRIVHYSDSDDEPEPPSRFAIDEDQILNFLGDSDPEAEDGELQGEDWIKELATQYSANDEIGQNVVDSLADITQKMLINKLPEDKARDLLAAYLRPANVPMLVPAKVDEKIWPKLTDNTQNREKKLLKICTKLVKMITAAVAQLHSIDALKTSLKGEAKDQIKELLKTGLDIIQLGACSLQDLNQTRRNSIKYDLNPQFRGLCAIPKEETTMLFGSNVSERVKEMAEVNKMSSKLTSKFSNKGQKFKSGRSGDNRRQHPYQRPQSSGQRPQGQTYRQYKQQPTAKKGQSKKVSSTLIQFTENTIASGFEGTKNFSAGQLATHVSYWSKLTSDNVMLTQILGCKIEFENEPSQTDWPKPYYFPSQKRERIDSEIQKLLQKGVIVPTVKQTGQFVSNIFTKEKKDGTLRIILDLTELKK